MEESTPGGGNGVTILRDYGTAAVHDFKAFSYSENLQWFNQILKAWENTDSVQFQEEASIFLGE